MNDHLEYLRRAAEQARKASSIDGDQTVVISLSEIGLVISGERRLTGRTLRHSGELTWQQFEGNPPLLGFMIRHLADTLSSAVAA